jgi:hypothetical protein
MNLGGERHVELGAVLPLSDHGYRGGGIGGLLQVVLQAQGERSFRQTVPIDQISMIAILKTRNVLFYGRIDAYNT